MRLSPSAGWQTDSRRRFLNERTNNGTNSSQSYLWHAPRLDPAGGYLVKISHHDFVSAHETLKLFGDYELLIDEALNGDTKLKAKVAQADRFNRGGLAVLQNAIKNRKISLKPHHADIMATCAADQAYWEAKQLDLSNIHERPNGKWQVQITVDEIRFTKTFSELSEAQHYRERMQQLAFKIETGGLLVQD
jgi:hypothetical protein